MNILKLIFIFLFIFSLSYCSDDYNQTEVIVIDEELVRAIYWQIVAEHKEKEPNPPYTPSYSEIIEKLKSGEYYDNSK